MSDPREPEREQKGFFAQVEALANTDDTDLRELTERDPVTADTMPNHEPFDREDEDAFFAMESGGDR